MTSPPWPDRMAGLGGEETVMRATGMAGRVMSVVRHGSNHCRRSWELGGRLRVSAYEQFWTDGMIFAVLRFVQEGSESRSRKGRRETNEHHTEARSHRPRRHRG